METDSATKKSPYAVCQGSASVDVKIENALLFFFLEYISPSSFLFSETINFVLGMIKLFYDSNIAVNSATIKIRCLQAPG
jgi:hypothetical protein